VSKMSGKSMAGVVSSLLLFVPIAGLSTAACAEQYVPLFDRSLVKGSNFSYTDIAQRYSYASKTITVYCDAPSFAYIKTDKGDGTYGPPLVDNYMTAGDDLKSVCVGGVTCRARLAAPIASRPARPRLSTCRSRTGSTRPA